jgi:hypothetical protein
LKPQPSNSYVNHSALRPLNLTQREVVVVWIEEIIQAAKQRDAAVILDTLDTLAFGSGEAILVLAEDDRHDIRNWLTESFEEDLLDLVKEGLRRAGGPRKEHPRATNEQLAIIEEAQSEVGLDFSAMFPHLTSWMADAVIKGIVVISEVQRQTGDRHFPLRDVRAAIREYTSQSGSRPSRPPRTDRR